MSGKRHTRPLPPWFDSPPWIFVQNSKRRPSPPWNFNRIFHTSVSPNTRIYNNPFPPLVELKNFPTYGNEIRWNGSRFTRGDHPSVKEWPRLLTLFLSRVSPDNFYYTTVPLHDQRGIIIPSGINGIRSVNLDERFRNVFDPRLSTRERINAVNIIVVNEGLSALVPVISARLSSRHERTRFGVFYSPDCIRRARSARIRKKSGEKKWSKLRGEKRTMTHLRQPR